MRITCEYEPDEEHLFRHHLNATMYSFAIDEAYSYCHSKLKHGIYKDGKEEEMSDQTEKVLEDIKEILTESYNEGMKQ